MILDQLRRQIESNSDNEWMEVEREMMNLVDAQAVAETLESLGCKYELHQDVLFVSLMGQCAGKNAVEEHLKQVFNVNSFHADNGDNIIVEWPGGRIDSDIDTAVYRGDHSRTAVDARGKPVPSVWVEVAHSNKKEDVDCVRSKFNKGLMNACPETIFIVITIPSMEQLKELKQSVPWSSDSSSCAEGKRMYNSFEKAKHHAKTEEASLVGIWQINGSVNRTFDNGGHWCVLTTDNYVKLELKLGDGESVSIRLYGIDLVHPDLKVEVQISIDDPNYDKAKETMVDMKTSFQVGQDQSVLVTTIESKFWLLTDDFINSP